MDNLTDIPFALDNPDTNLWGSGGSIDWQSYTGTTQGVSLFCLSLMHSDPTITKSTIQSWWGSKTPSSEAMYSAIVAQNHFLRITDIDDVLPGDVLALNYYSSGGSGAFSIIEDCPIPMTAVGPVVSGTTQYKINVVDSTSSSHGCKTDARWAPDDFNSTCSGGVTDSGAGRGTMRLYATSDGLPGAGTIVGYTWSLMTNTTYYPQAAAPVNGARPHAVGRFVK